MKILIISIFVYCSLLINANAATISQELCHEAQVETSIKVGYKVTDWKCRPAFIRDGLQLYYLDVTITHNNKTETLQYTVYPELMYTDKPTVK